MSAPSPQRTVPLPRLLLAWSILLGVLVVAFVWLRLSEDPVRMLVPMSVLFIFAAKAAVLLCMNPADFRRLSWGRFIACVIFPGMQPRRFLPENVPAKEDVRPTLGGVLTNLVAGLVLLWLIPWLMPASVPFFLRVWSGLVGAALLQLFVRFDIAVALFRWLGFGVERLWNCPGAATSVADFWGRRWNLVMSGLGREAIFMPLARRAGGIVALAAVFLYSGLVHEGISFGAGGGYGGPTAYFLIQGAGIWLEGRRWARRLTRARPWLGRAWATLVVVGPLALILHRPCMDELIVPLLQYMKVPGV